MKLFKTVCIAVMCSGFAGAHAQSTSGQLNQDITKLFQDVKADVANSDVTPQEIQSFEAAVKAIVAEAHKPSEQSVEQLQTLLKEAYEDGGTTPAQRIAIQAAFWNVINSAGIPASDVAALKQAMVAIYDSSNFTQAERTELVEDVEAILADLPEGGGGHTPS